MKKRIFAIITTFLMLAGLLSGCGIGENAATSVSSSSDEPGKIKIISTVFPSYDFAKQVVGDYAEVSMLLSPGGEVHSYEPSASDMLKIKSCDIFIYMGGEHDEWVADTLSGIGNDKIISFAMTDCVTLLEEEFKTGMEPVEEEHEEDEDASEKEYDAHVWTSPVNAIKIVQKITSVLCEADPVHELEYTRNSDAYIAKLSALDGQFRDTVSSCANKTVVFADRFPFRYLTEEYGLDYYAAFIGCSNQGTASLSTVKFLSDKVRELHIPAVLYIEFSSQEMADTICESTGCKKLMLHSCHNVSAEDFNRGVTYIELMQQNVQTLREALA